MDAESKAEVRQRQREAIWRWRWLGWRGSTPGFKGAIALLGLAAVALAIAAAGLLRV